MNQKRAAKARVSAVAGRITLAGTGLGALALIAFGAQTLLTDTAGSSATDATRQPVSPVTAALHAPQAATAIAALASSSAPTVWLSSIAMPEIPSASHQYSDAMIYRQHGGVVQRPLGVAPRVMTEAPTAPAEPTAGSFAAATPRTETLARPAAPMRDRAAPEIDVRQEAPRAVPPRRPVTQAIAAAPVEDVTAADATLAYAEPQTNAPRRSLLPRARPAEAQALAAVQLQTTPDAPVDAAPASEAPSLLASIGNAASGLLRSRVPAPRPEAVTRLASLSVEPTPTAPAASVIPAALEIPALTGPAARGNDSCTSAMTRDIPRRSRGADGGSTVIGRLTSMGGADRDTAIIGEVLQGNIPDFMRNLVPVSFSGTDARGQQTRVTICVTPDYLSVGSDRDFVRVPLGLPAASRVAERFDMVLPTTTMVDAIYQQAQVRLSPSPMDPTSAMVTTNYFLRHNATVQGQMGQAGARLGQLVSGHKKDLVLTNRLSSNPGRVAIYGWHQRNGRAIQPLSTVHGAQYADYSHGIRLVSRTAYVNGRAVDLRDLLSDSRVAGLVSSEGTITNRQMLALAD